MNGHHPSEAQIFEEASALGSAEERAAYLKGACGNDNELRARVEKLLAAHNQAAGFLEPAPEQNRTIRLDLGTVAASEKPGDTIGHYKLREKIGEGGCGEVYVADQEQPVRRRVALKIIKLGMATREVVARFEAERQALALMDHPNIAKVLDAGATDTGRPFFVMELVRGIKITDYCDQNKLATEERLKLFIQVCHAVQHAHQKGIIHRDIKPSNILVTLHDGVPVPKVIDFGIAKAISNQRLTDKTIYTAFEQFLGTPAYMSPEQAEMSGLDIDTRSDIYSLGVLLYELLTGRTPFDARTLLQAGLDQMRRIIREQEPPRPSTRLSTLEDADLTAVANHRHAEPPKLLNLIRGDLDWIVMKALEKDRTRRYETVNALAMDAKRHLGNEPVIARPPSQLYRFQKLVRRNKLVFAAASAVVASLILGLAFSTWQYTERTSANRKLDESNKNLDKALEQEKRAKTNEQQLRERAEAGEEKLKTALAAADFQHATDLIAQNNYVDAVPFLSRILSQDPTNAAALTRLTTLLAYHSWMPQLQVLKCEGGVDSAQFSPDGKQIVTLSGNTARVWDTQTGKEVAALNHTYWVSSGQFSADGKRIVTVTQKNAISFFNRGRRTTPLSPGGNTRVWVWDAQTGKVLTEPLKHPPPLESSRFRSDRFPNYSAQLSPDGRRIVTTSWDDTARVWDTEKGTEVTKPLKHSANEYVNSAQFSPDGKRIVTTSDDGTARVWDAQTGAELIEPLKHTESVSTGQFSPDGNLIVTASGDKTAKVWDALTGTELAALKHTSWVDSAQFSPDGKRIVTTAADGTARVWDTRTGKAVTEPLKDTYLVQFSPDGKQIVTAADDKTVRVWDAQFGKELTEPLGHASSVYSAQFSPDGNRIVTVSDDKAARVWNARTGKELFEPLSHRSGVRSAQFSPDGKHIVTASLDKTARVWDAQTTGRMLTQPLKQIGWVGSAQFSSDGKRILTFSGETARVWDARTGEEVAEPLRHEAIITSAQFSPDGRRILTASAKKKVNPDGSWTTRSSATIVRMWDAQTGNELNGSYPHIESANSVEFSPDGNLIVTASGDKTARVWDARTGSEVTKPLKHSDWVRSAQFSPDGNRIVTISTNTAQVWDARTGSEVTKPLKHSEWVRSARFSPDGNRIVTISTNTAQVWDAQTGKELTEPLKHTERLSAAQFSPDGKLIVTVSSDNTARVWDAHAGKELAELKHTDSVGSVQFSPDGKWILTKSGDTAQLWDTRTGKEASEPLRHAARVTLAEYSPDGKRILTVADNVRVWDITPVELTCPGWLLPLAEAVSGKVLNAQGVLEPTKQDPSEVLNSIRVMLSQSPGNDDWVVWGRWFLADPAARTISPFSSVAVLQYIENLIKEGDVKSLAEVAPLVIGNEPLLERIDLAGTIHKKLQQADNLQREGKLAEAESGHREVLELQQKLVGNESDRVAQSLASLVDILVKQKKFAEAELLAGESLEIRRKLFGNENAQVAQSLVTLADVLVMEKKFAEAKLLARESLEIRRKLFGNENQDVAGSLATLANILFGEKNFAEAESRYREALELQRNLSGNEHAEVAESLRNLAAAFAENGKLGEAESLARESLEIRRKLFGNENQDVAGSLATLAGTLLREQKFVEAELFARECLAIREKIMSDNWLTFNARSLLGGSLLGQKKYAESEPFLKSGYEGIEARKDAASNIVRLKEAGERLIQLYEATDRPDEATELRKQLPASP